MKNLKEARIEDDSIFMRSASGFIANERLDGGFNVYDNVLKLKEIYTLQIDVPEITFTPEGDGSYSYEEIIYHNLEQTPFVEVEWRDRSTVGSGETNFTNLQCTFDERKITINFEHLITRFGSGWGEPPVYPPIPAATYIIRVFAYILNTKKRLDNYRK